MKTSEIVLSLVAATFAGIAVVTWNGEAEAVERADKAQAALNAANVRNAALVKADGEHRARISDLEKSLKTAAAEAADTRTQLNAAIEGMRAAKKELEAAQASAKDAKDALAKAATKAAELEKARADAAAQVNALSTELAGLRSGSELRDAIERRKKAEADLEAASAALREANARAAKAEARVKELEEELARLKGRARGLDNGSSNYRGI